MNDITIIYPHAFKAAKLALISLMDYVDNPEGICSSEEDSISMWPTTDTEGYTPCNLGTNDATGDIGAPTAGGAFGGVGAPPAAGTQPARQHAAHTTPAIGVPACVTLSDRANPTWLNPIVEGGLQFPKSDTTSAGHVSTSYEAGSFLSSPTRHTHSTSCTDSAMSGSMNPYAYGAAYASHPHSQAHDDPDHMAMGTGSPLQDCPPLFEEKDIGHSVCQQSLKYEPTGSSVLDSSFSASGDQGCVERCSFVNGIVS